MAKVEIKRLDVISVAKIQAAVMAIIGFVIGIIVALVTSVAVAFTGLLPGAGLGFLSIIILPIVYGVVGFICGAVGAFLYNVVAARIGGVIFQSKK